MGQYFYFWVTTKFYTNIIVAKEESTKKKKNRIGITSFGLEDSILRPQKNIFSVIRCHEPNPHLICIYEYKFTISNVFLLCIP